MFNKLAIRLLDLLLSIVCILILLPIGILIALVILYSDGKPVLYLQDRTGRDFKLFKIYKFRTMIKHLEDESAITMGIDDWRITRCGKFLRATKLDEIPQFYNVLCGDMSIVGSRPQVSYYTERFRDSYKLILSRKPGLISPAAVLYYNEEKLLNEIENPKDYYEQVLIPIKCQMDQDLVVKFNVWKYVKVIFSSILIIVFGRAKTKSPSKIVKLL